MGFGNFSGGGKRTTTFRLNGKTGRLAYWVKDATGMTPGHEQEVEMVFGRVTKIEPVDRPGKAGEAPLRFIHVTFDDGNELVKVEMSRYANMTMEFLARLNNTDITKPVALSPWLMKAGTKINDFVASKDLLKMVTRVVTSIDANGVPTTGDVIKPFYGEQWKDKMPKGLTLKLPSGEDAKDQNGNPIVDSSWKQPYMDSQLAFVISRLAPGGAEGQADGQGLPEGVTPEELSSDDDEHSDRQRQV